MTVASGVQPATTSIALRPDLLQGEIALAQQCLLALLAGVHDRDLAAIQESLVRLRDLGFRLGSEDLAQWCVGVLPLTSPQDVEKLLEMLPTLITVWERTQHSLVSRAFVTTQGPES